MNLWIQQKTKSTTNNQLPIINITAGGLKQRRSWASIGTQRNFYLTIHLRLKFPDPYGAEFQPDTKIKLDVDIVNAGEFLGVELCQPLAGKEEELLAGEFGAEDGGGLVALVERRQPLGLQPLVFVNSGSFDGVVVHSDSVVGVSGGDVESQVEMKLIVGEVELGEFSVGDVEFDFVGTEYEP